jgi:hypothetical protein
MQDRELAVGRHDGQAVGLGHAARDLREELRRATPTEIGNPNQLAHVAPEPHIDLGRRAGEPLHSADVEERLVDRHPFQAGRGCYHSNRSLTKEIGCAREH